MTNKIEFTDNAKKEISRIISTDATKKYFRISVLGGGCSGFKYNFSFECSFGCYLGRHNPSTKIRRRSIGLGGITG